MNIELFQEMSCGLRSLTVSTEQATRALRELGRRLNELRPLWLMTRGGDWPDRFTLLNRYLRTDVEPEYFEDDRWQS